MSTALRRTRLREEDYPTGDGKPMAETPIHRQNLLDLISMLEDYYADNPRVYVSGNMLMYYVEGDKRRHVSPDVFVTFDIPKTGRRDAYFVWKEGKGPDVVIELSSKSTRREDFKTKFALYESVLKVEEYFILDPYEEYLDPPLVGYRLVRGKYQPIKPVKGRLPSRRLGLHLEREGERLRLWNPATRLWLPTPREKIETERQRADAALAELERLRAQLGRREGGDGRSPSR